jgi:Ca2+-binding EF-hand superfamily protein
LEKLKIGSEEAVALRKLIGFPKYDEIYIDDFVELVMRRSERNQISEKNLLEVFVRSFQNKKITVEQAMSLYDKNNDTEIDVAEFKGMTIDLGVKLDDKELLELMTLIDTNNSGLISIAELRSKLKALETELNPGKADEKKPVESKVNNSVNDPKKEIEPKRLGGMEQERLKKVDFVHKMFTGENIMMAIDKDRDRLEDVDEKQTLQNILDKQKLVHDMVKNNDLVPLVGEIKIQIQKLTDIKIAAGEFSNFFLLIRLPGSTKNWIEKEIYGKGLQDFKYAMRLTVMNVLEENISMYLEIKLIGINKLNVRQDLGTADIAWKKCLEFPNEWVINNSYKLLADNRETSPCEMKMQIKWITFGNAEFKATVYDDYYLKKGFTAPKTEEGSR